MELRAGVFSELFARLSVQAEALAPVALTTIGLAVERQAKINASNGEHPYRTPTPAQPGNGPARISGQLVRAITHTEPARTATGWEVQVGMAAGLYPWYSRRTPSSLYAYYLEVAGAGKSRTLYPFLGPAFQMQAKIGAYAVFDQIYRALGTGI